MARRKQRNTRKRKSPADAKASMRFWRVYTFSAVFCLVLGAGAVGGSALWQYLKTPGHFPIRHVEILGRLEHLSPAEISAGLQPELKRNFFTLPVADMTAMLQALPWVKTVVVHRRWPDALVLNIVEQHAVATWNHQQLVNSDGALFAVGNLPDAQQPTLQLLGPEDGLPMVWQHYQQAQQLLTARGLPPIQQLQLSLGGCWSLRLANTEVVIGADKNWVHNLQRLQRLLPILTQRKTPVRRIDLRYPLGVAIA